MTSNTLRQARWFADSGCSVIPLDHPDETTQTDPTRIGKTPVIGWKEFQAAHPTDDNLVAWFSNGHRRNIAVLTGAISNLVVIDCDSREAVAWADAYLPPTPWRVRTSKGEHRGYRHPGIAVNNKVRIRTDDPAIKIDVRGDGGYVVGASSKHRDGTVYEWIGEPPSFDALPVFDPAWLGSEAPDDTTTTPPLPAVVSEGNRNNTLFKEGCRLRRLGLEPPEILAALIAINRQRCHPPLDAQEVEVIAQSCAKYESAVDTFPLTEAGDAEFFAACNADDVRYDHRSKRWLVFREHYWAEQTTGDVHRLALDAMRARQSAAVKSTGEDRPKRIKWAVDGEARKRLTNLLALAENIKPLADAGDSWDVDAHLLGVQNGVIDLRTGVLRPGRPEDRITLVSPVSYDPNASTARWRQFVLDVCDGNSELADYFQVVCGYILTGETGEQCFWIFYGEGANGKSTFLETLTRHVIPNHAWSMNFPSTKWSESMNDYQKAQLVSRRLIVSKENEQTQRLNTEFIKSVTGDEALSARHPYGRPFNFTPVAKFILAVNHKPTILDETHGMWRRVRLMPFLRTFDLNPSFAKSLVAEAPGGLAWAVEGAGRYYADGLTTPDLVLAATAKYRQESNPLAPFFAERCVLAADKRTKAQQLFDALRDWYEQRQTPTVERLSQKDFGRRIAADSRFVVANGKGQERFTVFYHGVGFVD